MSRWAKTYHLQPTYCHSAIASPPAIPDSIVIPLIACNPVIRGWITYYGRYYKSALYPTLRYLDQCLVYWAMAKYKRLKRHRLRAEHWVSKTASRDPRLFAHWPLLRRAATGR